MAMATVVAANILKGGGALLLSCCNRNRGGPRRPPSLLSTCSFSSSLSLPLSRTSNILKGGGVLRFPSYCTAAAADTAAKAAVPLSSSSIPPPPVPEAGAGEISSSSPSLDPIKEAAEMLDIRVGRILRAWRHEEADSLYVEEVDVGEAEPRIICSGLVNYIPLDHLQDKKVVVLANLKPRNMRGVKSCGMLMAASDASHDNVELLLPPEGSVPGERIWFGTEDDKENQPAAASPNQIQKKKIWELVQPHLKTDASCSAVLGMHFMRTSAGVVVCGSLANGNIS